MTEQTNNLPEAPTSVVIQAYSIFEYTQKIEEAISEGYSFKLLTNEGTPQQFGFHYEVTMYKKPTNHSDKQNITVSLEPEMKSYINGAIEEVKELQKEQEAKTQPQKQRGRPSVK